MRTDEHDLQTASAVDIPATTTARREIFGWALPAGSTTADLAVSALALLLCTAFLPIFVTSSSTPRTLLLLASLPFGLLALARLARAGDRAAIALVALLVWSLLSAARSDSAWLSLRGGIGREASVLVYAAAAGIWALGRFTSAPGRRLVALAVLGGCAMSAVVGLMQVLLQLDTGTLPLVSARPTGLTPNPVYFGALMAAAAALSAWPLSTTKRPAVALVAVTGFTTMVHLSGTRVAMLASLATVGYVALRQRRGRGLLAVPAVAAGSVLAWIVNRAVGGGASALARIDEGSGSGGRFDIWRYALDAFRADPFFGHGVGRFRSAVQGEYTAAFSSGNVDFDTQWFDAHNLVVEIAVALGVVGLVVFSGFCVFTARSARGPLAVAVAAIAITWLLEPAALATLPVALLMLGAAGPPGQPSPLSKPSRVTAAAVAALLVAYPLVTELRFDRAVDRGDPAAIEAAARWLWHDPIANDLATQAWTRAAIAGEAPLERAIESSERTVRLEPDRAGWWERAGAVRMFADDLDGARDRLETALELQPWRPSTWQLMYVLGERSGDDELRSEAMERICVLELPECEQSPADG